MRWSERTGVQAKSPEVSSLATTDVTTSDRPFEQREQQAESCQKSQRLNESYQCIGTGPLALS